MHLLIQPRAQQQLTNRFVQHEAPHLPAVVAVAVALSSASVVSVSAAVAAAALVVDLFSLSE
jgi:hypothetical protein